MRSPVSPSIDRLCRDLVGGDATDGLALELTAWLAASPRFVSFAEAHRDKIRKKLRTARDAASRRDVRAELRVAALLLADRRIDLSFEQQGAARGGPDFTVEFREHPACFLEVTRPRRAADADAMARAVLAKLRQVPPGMPTVLVVAIDGGLGPRVRLDDALRGLRSRVDARDTALLRRGGFDSPRDFYQRFLRLAAVVAWSEAADGSHVSMWLNPSARLALPDAIARALAAALRGDETPRPPRR